MPARLFKGVLIVLCFAGALQAQTRQGLLEKIPNASALKDWKLSRPPTDYDATTIDTLSGAPAPTLKLYGIKGALMLDWNTPHGHTRATLFEMMDSPAAYGFFTSQRKPSAKATPVLVGAGSFREGALFLWQSNYVVRIEGPPTAQDLLAGVLAENILGDSWKPTVSEHLPPAHLVPGTEKYLLSAEGIDRSVGIDPDTLGFDYSVEAAMASYRVNGVGARLLLLHYPTQHIARKYAEQFDLNAAAPPVFRKRDGPLVAIVFDTTDQEVAKTILDGVDLEYTVVYDQSNPVAGYAQMILTIFKLIGIALLCSVGAGVAFGAFRVLMKKRFPDRVFDRPQDVEIIQLKLDQSITRKELTD